MVDVGCPCHLRSISMLVTPMALVLFSWGRMFESLSLRTSVKGGSPMFFFLARAFLFPVLVRGFGFRFRSWSTRVLWSVFFGGLFVFWS